MILLEKIFETIKNFNLEIPTLDNDEKLKMGIFNVVLVTILPIIVIVIIYLLFKAENLAKTLSVLIFLFSIIIYLLYNGKYKVTLYIMNVAFILPTLLLLSNLIHAIDIINIDLSIYITTKITIITSLISAILFIPEKYKKSLIIAITYNLSILIFYDTFFEILEIDYLTIGKFNELFISSYRIISFILIINAVIIAILIYAFKKNKNSLIKNLIINKNALEKQSKLNKDKISELSLERDKVLNELDYLQNYRFNFLVNWKKIYLDSTFAYFVLEFESQHLELENSYLVTNEVINTFKILDSKENDEIKFTPYLPRILRVLLPVYLNKKLDILEYDIDEIYVNKFKYSLIAKKENNNVLSFFLMVHKKLQDFQITKNYDHTSKFHIFNKLSDYVIVFDNDGKILYVNQKVLDGLSYSRGDFDKIEIQELSESFRKNIFESLIQSIRKNNYEKSITLIGRLGEKIYLEAQINELIYDNYNLFVLVGRDNLSYLEIIQEMKSKDQDYERLLNISNNVIFKRIVDNHLTTLFFSDNIIELSGYDKYHFYNNEITFDQIIIDKDKDLIWSSITKALNLNTPYQVEYSIQTKNGKIKKVKESGISYPNTQKKEIYVYGYIEDLSGMLNINSLSNEYDSKISKIINYIDKPICIFDFTGKPIYYNNAFLDYFEIKSKYKNFTEEYNLTEDEKILKNDILIKAINSAKIGESIENLEFDINNYKIKCNLIPIFDKIKMTQQILFIINDFEKIN